MLSYLYVLKVSAVRGLEPQVKACLCTTADYLKVVIFS